jgi:small-conductance mechanosensitive channel
MQWRSRSARHERRVGLGILAVGSAVFLTVLAVAVAAALSDSDPLAPALVGGGGALLALGLARWGYRELRPTA